MARLLRLIRNDISWLNSRFAAIGAILGIGLILGVWYAGKEWWLAPMTLRWAIRRPSRLEVTAVILTIIFICYIVSAIDRARRSR